MALQIERKREETICVLELIGILDISTASLLHDEVKNLSEISELILNFSKVEFIDSTGVGVIVDLLYHLNERNHMLRIIEMNEEVYEICETIGVFQIFDALQGEMR